jgi:hypothetical protein
LGRVGRGIVVLGLVALYLCIQAELDPEEYAQNHPVPQAGVSLIAQPNLLENDKESGQEFLTPEPEPADLPASPLCAIAPGAQPDRCRSERPRDKSPPDPLA